MEDAISPNDNAIVVIVGGKAVLAKRRDDDYYAITTRMPISAARQARKYYFNVNIHEFREYVESVGAKCLE